MTLKEILAKTSELGGSDLHITVAAPPTIRKNGKMLKIGEEPLTPKDTENYTNQALTEEQCNIFREKGEVDFSFSLDGVGRFRVNAFKQRGSCSMAIRLVNQNIPNVEELGLSETVIELSDKTRGLILVTGPTGSGKSTTLASIIDLINSRRDGHILTLEDPIEYLHKHKCSIVNQREIGSDSFSYASALKSALREDPDVILVGEMRDIDTISIAVTAAETGHLVLSTLHTTNAANTIDRIIDVFPPYQQQQIRCQLSAVLQGVISQQLVPRSDKVGRIAAIEIMTGSSAVKNLIREGKTHQIDSLIQTGARYGMQSMDSSLVKLYKEKKISYDDVIYYASSKENIKILMARI